MKRIATVLLLGLLAACGDGGKKAPSSSAASAPPPAEVDVIVVKPGVANLSQDLPGRLSAKRSAQVRARIEGVVEKRLFAEGTDIKAGAPLFRIDARSYRATAAAAEADLAAVKASLDRYGPLLAIKAVSQQEFDQAQAKFKQAEAAVAKANLDLENANPTAPISGRIGRALVTEGALVGKGEATHLATIEQIDPIRVEFTQSYADLLRLQRAIKSGQQKKAASAQVELVLDDGSVFPLKGRLQFQDLAVDPNTGAVALRAEFPNPHRELLPGTFVQVRLPQASIDNVIRVPQRALSGGPKGQSVMVVDAEGKVQVRPVKTGTMAGQDFVITDGLKGGEQVIVNGLQKARPGSVVKPTPWNPAEPLLSRPKGPPGSTPAALKLETKLEKKQ
ncbi:MAG: efflux RND transporter periplasmic adaptor subunit [Sulfuritalea sp.]|nr:efflux RND transporter periplasmic adaptor subunit [Sulfuritalea sp.]